MLIKREILIRNLILECFVFQIDKCQLTRLTALANVVAIPLTFLKEIFKRVSESIHLTHVPSR